MTETAKRAGVFDDSPDFDVKDFAPKTPKSAEKPVSMEALKAVSEAAQFQSREPVTTSPKRTPKAGTPRREIRRYRTGRDVQFNVRCNTETRESFYAIADQQGWKIAETLEQAVDALKQKISPQK